MNEGKRKISRREFLKKAATAGAVASTITFLKPAWAQQPQLLKAGLIGCGGRGTGAGAQFMQCAPNCRVVALADVFEDRVQSTRKKYALNKVEIPDDMCFTGFDAYKQLLQTDVDVVLIATPPYFRPEIFEAAIDAGKHVFMEKPVAVDPVGARRIMEAGKKAKEKGLCVVAGTQRRHQAQYVETQKRIADGMIGRVVAMRCYWCGGPVRRYFKRQPDWNDIIYQVRNWVHFTWLSGDHIVEQHVHNIDVCNWFFGGHPIEAMGFGAQVQRKLGNQYDFFCVDFTYDRGVHCESMCRQIIDCDHNVSEFVVCEKGTTDCRGTIWDHDGKVLWKFQGKATNPYVQEHADLVNAIRGGKYINEAQNVAEATMSAIMGRQSAYTGKRVTWDQMMKSDLTLGPADYRTATKFEIGPAPKPGKPFAPA